MLTLFPAIRPYKKHCLVVDGAHQLYVEECGEPDGLPILILHGGPGMGCTEIDRRYCDPNVYRMVIFDQRGCGRSTPHGNIENNNTKKLIEDIETIRELLNIDKWIVFGGSWGSSLALLYSIAHSDRVMGLILRGVFLNRAKDKDWFNDQMRNVFPDFWEDFVSSIPEDEHHDLISAYHKRLFGKDDLARMQAAKNWVLWETRCSTLDPNPHLLTSLSEPTRALPLARIECHYFKNDFFVSESEIVDNIEKIHHIPGIIIHGRYDMICPLENAWILHKIWPISQLNIIREAGHSCSELGIIDAVVRATKSMAQRHTAA